MEQLELRDTKLALVAGEIAKYHEEDAIKLDSVTSKTSHGNKKHCFLMVQLASK